MFKIHTCVYVCFDMFHAFQSMVVIRLEGKIPGSLFSYFCLFFPRSLRPRLAKGGLFERRLCGLACSLFPQKNILFRLTSSLHFRCIFGVWLSQHVSA